MPRIPYVDPDKVTDPEIKGYLERARREGTPRPESQAVRANVPDVIRAFSQAWELTFRNGVVDHGIGFAYVMNRMDAVTPDTRAMSLVDAVRACL